MWGQVFGCGIAGSALDGWRGGQCRLWDACVGNMCVFRGADKPTDPFLPALPVRLPTAPPPACPTTPPGAICLQRLDPEALRGRHKYRKDKDERMKSVLEGE